MSRALIEGVLGRRWVFMVLMGLWITAGLFAPVLLIVPLIYLYWYLYHIGEERRLNDLGTESTAKKLREMNYELDMLISDVQDLKKEKRFLNGEIEASEFGLYKPKYEFATSSGYKERLSELRKTQRQQVKDKTAVTYPKNFQFNDSLKMGQKMIDNNIKQLLRAFNSECDTHINKVNYRNIETIAKRIEKSFDTLNKMGDIQQIQITKGYLVLKLEELYLAYEYKVMKQDEQEALREQKRIEAEEKAAQKELEREKEKVEKDIVHNEQMVDLLKSRIKTAGDDDAEQLRAEIAALKAEIEEKESEKETLEYRKMHSRAGYVYVISNIGAFGKDVVKIGVTRRHDPLLRIKELSSASVPFPFDVHALVYSTDAYELESELHAYFDDARVNLVNRRKEFFKIPIEKVEEKLKAYGNLTIEFEPEADAEEFYESQLLLAEPKKNVA